jgi:hypothetical protein
MSLYQEFKVAKFKAEDLESKINKCNHTFMHSAEERVIVKTKVYSAMDGCEVDGPEVYGFRRYQTCSSCGLFRRSESKSPGKWSRWENV